MASTFDEDFAIANDLFAEAFGITGGVELQRAGWSTPNVAAEVVLTDHEVLDGGTGFTSAVQSRDYLIAVSDYQINEEIAEPKTGDTIVETINGVVCKFQVAPMNNRKAAEWDAADGLRWIIRTKKVA